MPFRVHSYSEAEFQRAVTRLAETLKAEVIYIRWKVKPDSQGDDALFFQVLLRDRPIQKFMGIAQCVQREVEIIVTDANCGYFPHFRFRSDVEQQALKDKDWE
jgi:hypothetical protein